MRGFGREISRFGNISGKTCESITVARSLTPSCRAVCLPAGHCPNLGNRRLPALGARAARRRGRSEAKRAAEDGRIGDVARSGEKCSMERRTPSQMSGTPPASVRPSAGAPAPDGHGHPLLRMRLLQPRFNLSGEGAGDAVCGLRAFFEFTGVPLGLGDQVPDAATPLKIRRRRLDRGCRVRRGAELR